MKLSTPRECPLSARRWKHRTWAAIVVVLTCGLLPAGRLGAEQPGPKSLKILLVTGGCCHDYKTQKDLIKRGLEARAHVDVTAIEQGDGTREAKIPLYENADWAQGYDLVIHDECFGAVTDVEWCERVLAPHKTGLPAVVIHCGVHCFRNGTDNWHQFCGVTSRRHGAQYPHEVLNADADHPIMRGFGAAWANPAGELYWIEKVWPTAHPLAVAKNRENGNAEVCVWTNDYHGTRVFGTTLGHHNETVESPQFLDLLARGTLWACGRLDDTYLKPRSAQRVPLNLALGKTATASTVEPGGHEPALAIDGKPDTRWCASSDRLPEWWQVDLGAPQHLTGCRLDWEKPGTAYRYRLEGSADGEKWDLLVDNTEPNADKKPAESLDAQNVRFVRVTCVGSPGHGWASLREVALFGDQTVELSTAARPAAEEKLLAEFTAPEGYDATLFAAPPAVEYPVYVAAAPDGVLYVSSDRNGSIDRQANRGSIYRLRDVDGDGRADEVKLFVPNVDSPRGSVWDRDRLYLMHPPHLSAFIDSDGDGRADQEQILVKNIAFDFKDRPADHTSNGVTLGVDGWLYLAIGDFGFMQAEGADGRQLQFRGGGVVRVRPDGTGLEIYSRGTRNILEVALDPLLNGFSRDNTNDGGGWDIRLHHFSGLEDHGYPRMFKNFGDEIIHPLADYGGGSGCGALFLDEPGFPGDASPAAYTADWGQSWIYSHRLTPKGATFAADQKQFLRIDRVTDLDVDANSHIYATSWHGAVFTYVGEEVGFLVRVTPKVYTPEPLPDFARASQPELVRLLESSSHRRRLAAQRELLARGLNPWVVDALRGLAVKDSAALPARVAAVFALKQGLGAASNPLLVELARDAALRPFAIRALADREDQLADLPVEPLLAGLADPQPRTRLEAAIALARLGKAEHAVAILPLLADDDPVIVHTAIQSLARVRAADACFTVVDRTDASAAMRSGALRALARMHEAAAVEGLIARLEKETDAPRRRSLLSALARLYNHEGAWAGNSWGTRPDTTGPYFQPEPWDESPKIAAALKRAVDAASGDEPAWILAELHRNRVHLDGTVDRLLAMAATDPSLIPAAVAELKFLPKPPASALPLLESIATGAATEPATRAIAAMVLLRFDDPSAFPAVIDAIGPLHKANGDLPETRSLRDAFMQPGALAPHFDVLEAQARRVDGMTSVWAEAGLLSLAAHKQTSPEERAAATRSVEVGWNDAPRRAQILKAALLVNDRSYADKALSAAGDPANDVADAANRIVRAWQLDKQPASSGPTLKTLKPEQVVAEVTSHPGEPARGEQLFTRLNCGKCHTVKPGEALRGPFLPQVAKTYKRGQLAESVLLPNKSIAQGFVTYLFVLDNGTTVTGFVTSEGADEITLRDAEGREIHLPVSQIEERKKQEISIMPEGLVKDLTVEEFGALISYVESLAPLAEQAAK
ncbi:MAG TPA: discoidin domain-containing protein [Pirellulales bacterium]|jgi:putative heme-binding domain-containing protein|nr:discoidin domain-containing protein [Pirellulales bacterium]